MTSELRAEEMREILDNIYRTESRHILATLIRLLGDFDRTVRHAPRLMILMCNSQLC